jgi:flagellar hook-basal body complex protein FliE
VTVTPFIPDGPHSRGIEPDAPAGTGTGLPGNFAAALARALDGAGAALARADGAERAFISGRGGLQEMVVERAQADVLLAIAGAAAARTVQALNTILGMQI